MDEKDKQSLTFDDILNQLTKPSVIQGQGQNVGTKTPPPSPSSAPAQQVSRPPVSGGFKLPSLGGEQKPAPIPGSLPTPQSPQPSNIFLSIRTMAQDIQRLRSGQMPTPLEVKKTVKSNEIQSQVPKPTQVIEPEIKAPVAPPITSPELPTSPSSPPPLQLPKIFAPPIPTPQPPLPVTNVPPVSKEKSIPEYIPEHFHKEKIVSGGEKVVSKIEDALPEYLGAPVPKKVVEQIKERLEYRVLARIIGSGMTAGITVTIIIAIAAYLLLSFFVFNKEEPAASPTPIPTSRITQTPEPDELESIFGNVTLVNFSLPVNQIETTADLKTLIKGTEINLKEFKRVNFILSDNQAKTLTFTGLLDRLSVRYPADLPDAIKEGNMAFMYGQGEVLGDSSSLPDPGLANKKVVLIVEVKDLVKATGILREWEPTMPQDFKDVFNIEPSKAATPGFNNNEYRGVPIKYKNFPLPDRSIDYAIVHSLSGRQYLIITNSRESMYSPIEKVTGL